MAQLIVPYYGGCKNSRTLQRRYVLGELGGLVTPPLFITQLEWLKIEKKKVTCEVAVNVFKVKSKLFPDWFMQFPTNNEILQTSYTTRQQYNLYVSRTNTDHGVRSFVVLGPNIWNALPDNVINTLTLQVFRKRLKAFLMNNYVAIN